MHLGSRVSALLDGRLAAAEEERAWAHVHECNPCRDLVEREGWVKTQLAGLSLSDQSERGAPDRLKHSLLASSGSALGPVPFPTVVRSRHRSLVAIGGGAAGAAVMGVLVLGAAGTPQLERRAPVGDLSRPTPTSTPSFGVLPGDRAGGRASRRQSPGLQSTPTSEFTPTAVVVRETRRVRMAP